MDNLRIYLSTWNVGTNNPNQDINGLLDFPTVQNKHRTPPDFYILGFQEVKSQPQNIVMDAIFSDPWTTSISKILCKNDYILVKSIRLQGILLLVYCLRKHILHLRDVETQYTKTGLGGIWGNKGAVSIRLTIYGCSICIVNSHLTAHDHLLDDRVSDYNSIIKLNTFNVRDTTNIMFHDYVFWLGDLNFRLDEKLPETPEQIIEQINKIEKDDYSQWLAHDQLKKVMKNGSAFSELKENLLHFPPTYKFDVGSNEYDPKRRPAWTDRILFKVVPDNYENVTLKADQLSYHSLPQFTISDHKPVIAEFNIKIRMKETPVVKYRSLTNTDYSSISNQIPEETVVFSHYVERCVEFAPIKDIWYIGESDFVTKYTLSRDVQIFPNDWIAVYEANFTNLDDYITYEYVGKVCSVVPSVSSESRTLVFSFPVGSGVRSPGFYRFLYFSQPITEVRSLLGMSDVFEVRARENNGTPLQNTNLQSPSTSEVPSSSNQETSTIENLVKDFSNIHVPGLNFNMLNDLSID